MFSFRNLGFVATLVASVLIAMTPPAQASDSFADDDGSVHENDIEALATAGITHGCNPPANDHFCPERPVTRGEMATFMTRALGISEVTFVGFVDIDDNVHKAAIEKFATAGITKGCNPPANDRFCPNEPVSRAEMATFLARAYGLSAGAGLHSFSDISSSIHEDDIARLATAGVTRGCNPPINDHFCPEDPVTRAQMATFLMAAQRPSGPTGDSGIIWRANHESGNLDEWWGVTSSSTADAQIVPSPTRSDNQVAALTVRDADGTSQPGPGVRLRVEKTALSSDNPADPKNLPDDAYYSAWFYFPDQFQPYSNILQWKQAAVDRPDHQTRRLLYYLRADWDSSTQSFHLGLRGKAGDDGTMASRPYPMASSSAEIPTNTWVHIECRYLWDVEDGRITCWLNDQELWDVTDIPTEYTYDYIARPRQWTVNHYVDATTPTSHTIFIDDAIVSLERTGP